MGAHVHERERESHVQCGGLNASIQQALGIFLSLPVRCWDYKHTASTMLGSLI